MECWEAWQVRERPHLAIQAKAHLGEVEAPSWLRALEDGASGRDAIGEAQVEDEGAGVWPLGGVEAEISICAAIFVDWTSPKIDIWDPGGSATSLALGGMGREC